jgi:hypothetical protein
MQLREEIYLVVTYLMVVYHVFAAFFSTAPPFPLHVIIASMIPVIAQGQTTFVITAIILMISAIFIALHLLAGFESFTHTKLGWFLSIFLTAFWTLTGLIVILLVFSSMDILTYAWVLVNLAMFATLWHPAIRRLFAIQVAKAKTNKKS